MVLIPRLGRYDIFDGVLILLLRGSENETILVIVFWVRVVLLGDPIGYQSSGELLRDISGNPTLVRSNHAKGTD